MCIRDRSGKWLEVSGVAGNNFNVNVGKTPRANYLVSAATYTPTTGDMTLTIGAHNYNGGSSHTITDAAYNPTTGILTATVNDHGFVIGDRVKFDDNSITFNCAASTGTHTWVSGVTNAITANDASQYTAATGTSYNPTTGLMVLEIGSHSLTTSNTVTIANSGVTFTCDADNHGSNHAYPRATDPASSSALAVLSPTATTITVNVGIANADQPDNNHTYPRATDYPSDKWLEVTNITQNTFDVMVLASAPQSVTSPHTFVSAVTNGLKSAHEAVYIEEESLVFKCQADNFGSEHKYPRANGNSGATADDPYYDDACPIISVTADTITVNVGISSNTTTHQFVRSENAFTPSTASYVPGTGVLTITVNGHPFENGDKVQLKNGAFVFECNEDLSLIHI